VLGFWGHRSFAPELNSGMSLPHLSRRRRCSAARTIADGPYWCGMQNFFVDSFQRVPGGVDGVSSRSATSLFKPPVHAHRVEPRQAVANRLRLYHRCTRVFSFTMLLALLTNNVGLLLGGDGSGHAHHPAAAVSLYRYAGEPERRGSTSSCAAWGLRRRCSAHTAVFRRGESAGAGWYRRCCGRI